MKRSFLIAIFICVAIVAPTWVFAQSGIRCQIRFADKAIYYPGDPVLIKISLRNEGSTPYRFKLAEDKAHSIGFDVRTMSNRALEASATFLAMLGNDQPVYFRELSLEGGEEYSFEANLSDFVSISEPGTFRIQCGFYPELSQRPSPSQPVMSNYLNISVRPNLAVSVVQDKLAEDKRELLKAERLAPDEMISKILTARQHDRLNEFFLYVDLESLIKRDVSRKRIYDKESEDGKARMLSRFREDLSQAIIDQDIMTIPSSFEIIKTEYNESSGTVRVLERFQRSGYIERKEYTYYISRRDGVWYVVNYTVTNKGNE